MLNPDKNLYSVAPVGGNIIVGRFNTLKASMTRDQAMNLLTWLIISTKTNPKEIAEVMAEVCTPNMPSRPKPVVVPKPPEPVNLGEVETFIGNIDPEEQAALDAAIEEAGKTLPSDIASIAPPGASPTLKCGPQVVSTPRFIPSAQTPSGVPAHVVNENELLSAWGGK